MFNLGGSAKKKIEERLAALCALPFAHRGLHSPNGPAENTLRAFDAAIRRGFGIELDVQLTAEGGAVVFHDETLDRLTEETGTVLERTTQELTRIRLNGSVERITSLQDVLHHIGGRVPLLIEAKALDDREHALGMAIRRALEGYVGPVGIMSFHSEVSRWYHDHFPTFLNGIVLSPDAGPSRSGPARAIAVRHGRPKFIAYDVRSLPTPGLTRFRGTGRRVLAWTVRNEADVKVARENVDQMIVEGDAAELLAAER